jgi:oligopeptide/dipeptide ABC transporter ATP-binding protein
MTSQIEAEAILSVRGLSVDYQGRNGTFRAVNNVSFDVWTGETLGIVGESGSGKSSVALSLLGLVEHSGGTSTGQVLARGRDLLSLSERERVPVRGGLVGLVFQNPMSRFNPVVSVGTQLMEAIRASRNGPGTSAMERERAATLLTRVGIPDARERLEQFPIEYSGGMLQRAMIAAGLGGDPAVLVADEPTTALDVTTQAQVLELFREVVESGQMAAILVTHNLSVVAEVADRVLVLYAGEVMHVGDVFSVFSRPRHPYTAALLASRPDLHSGGRRRRLPVIAGSLGGREARKLRGCPFQPRCSVGADREVCRTETPALRPVEGQLSACHFAEELASGDTDRA